MKNYNEILAINSLTIPAVALFGKIRQAEDWINPGRRLSNNLMVYMTDGSADFAIEGSCFNVRKNDIIFVRKNELYKIIARSSCEYYFAHFDGDITELSDKALAESFSMPTYWSITPPQNRLTFKRHITLSSEEKSEFSAIMSKINAQKQEFSQKSSLRICLLFYEAIVLIGNSKQPDELHDLPQRIKNILAYIYEHLSDGVTLASVCERFSLSKQYVCQLFRKHLNQSVNHVILAQKMKYASELLEFSSLNVTEVSQRLGYDNIYYFSRQFKEFYGFSPSSLKLR